MGTELRIKPRYYFNFDSVSAIIGEEENRPIYMSDSARKTLQELKLSVSKASSTVSNEKRRGIKQLYLTSADYWLLAAVIMIRDRNIKNVLFQHLSNDGGYQTWVIFIPNLRGIRQQDNNANGLVS